MYRYRIKFDVNGERKTMIVEASGIPSAMSAAIESMQGFYGVRPKILNISGGRPVHTVWRMCRK